MYVVRPAYAQADRSFAFWLNSVVDLNVSPDLRNEVVGLDLRAASHDVDVNIYDMMHRVSELLSKADQEGRAEDPVRVPLRIYNVLLQQWDHFQNSKGMAATPTPPAEVLKPLLSSQVDKFQSGSDLRMHSSPFESAGAFEKGLSFEAKGFYSTISPMATGIAIGAP